MRSISRRNYWGGFWGGVLGIFAFSWHAALLPVGCFVGVVAGFWYQEIGRAVAESLKTVQRQLGDVRFRGVAYLARAARTASALTGWILAVVKFACRVASLVCAFARIVRRHVPTYGRVVQWLSRHPMNRAYALFAVAAAIWAMPGVFYALRVERWIRALPGDTQGLILVFVGVVFGYPLTILLTLSPWWLGDPVERAACFYRWWARYAAYGNAKFLLYQFVLLVRNHLAVVVFWMVTIAGIVSAVVGLVGFMVFLTLVGLLRGVYRVTKDGGHWLCFGVTLIVTGAAAWLTNPHLHGVGLWLVALITGCASGVAAEGARRIAASVFERHPALLEFLYRSTEEHMGNGCKVIGRGFAPIVDWCSPRLFVY
ncbi:hypothetical protein HYW67_01410 [Candidatus Parcubacteria bacterium]|nr:hypothetical protein [Candidatus Parcubacteria bacterium]